MFLVTLESCGNIDYGQCPDRPLPGVPDCKAWAATLEEAAEKCRRYIEEYGLGAGNWAGGEVTRNNKRVAYVSYNGRIWPEGEKS